MRNVTLGGFDGPISGAGIFACACKIQLQIKGAKSMKATNGIQALVAAALIGAAGAASATSPVAMTYTLRGEAGDWTLNFDVSNDMVDSDQTVYFLGVAVDGGSVSGSPATFDSTPGSTWTNSLPGGSNLTYNAIWSSGGHLVGPGTDLNGFVVHSSAVDQPAGVNWFAFTSGSAYTGGGYFNTAYNPGWDGVAPQVPEPSNIALLIAGLGICGFAAKRRSAAR
jgi:hypothetical protein